MLLGKPGEAAVAFAIAVGLALGLAACGGTSSPALDCEQLTEQVVYEIATHKACTADEDCAYAAATCELPAEWPVAGCGALVDKNFASQASALFNEWLARCNDAMMADCSKSCTPVDSDSIICYAGRCALK